ncbi:MAG: ArsR family transcriptional regulator [archaeon GB-1867-005]|nr:ArsR family transcriptional regulator [Candidatus Culexmicrobium cathedralense]
MGSDTRSKVLSLLSDCRPRSFSEIVRETGLGRKAVERVLYRLWKERF